jgi:amino acid adenylation domain-containing protein
MSLKNKNIEAVYPLSPMQQGMLFHSLYDSASGVYVNQLSWDFYGKLNIPAFTRAWQQVINRHSVLRTAFVWENLKEPLQIVGQYVKLDWEEQDWQNVPHAQQQERLENFLNTDRKRGFELSKAPLMRLVAIKLDESHYHFVWSNHHLLMDGWSVPIIFKEVITYYKEFNLGKNPELNLPYPYQNYIAWLKQQDVLQAEEFWRKKLKGFAVPTTPRADRASLRFTKFTVQNEKFDEQEIKLSNTLTAALKSLGQRQHLTLNTLVQGAWALLLSRYTTQEDVVFGAVVSGRPSTLPNVESMVGMFINTLPTRVQVTPNQFLLPWLQHVQAQYLETCQYEYSSLVQIQGWSEVPRNLPLFESLIVFENYPMNSSIEEQIPNLKVDNIRVFEKTNYPLNVVAIPNQELTLKITYDCHRFSAATITRMLGHLQVLLEGMVNNPQQRVSELPLLTQPERHQLLVEWNDTERDYPKDKCIHQLFEEQVEKTPDAVAVVFEEQQLTYRQLNARANQLAHHLKSLGVKPETLVGIWVERSLEMVIGLLGILKAGGAYVPLDPHYPQERLSYILADSGIDVLLTQQSLLPSLPPNQVQTVCLDTNQEVIEQYSGENVVVAIDSGNLAYVIYTSGSTGQPKGVLVEHQNVTRLFAATQSWYHFDANDVWTNFHSIAFDFSVWEIWGALFYGGRLVIVPYWVSREPESFYDLLCSQKVTILNQTPSAFRQLINVEQSQERESQLNNLRLVIFGGEALEIQSLRPWFERHGDLSPQLVNMYGITETTVHVTYRPLSIEDLNGIGSVIGSRIPDLQMYILDDNLQPVPIGVKGEMYIGGAGVARGYLNRQQLTQERFIPNPFNRQPDALLYKTGDLARYLSNGDLEYLGRIDHQVKIRGFRIELGEIEAVLNTHPQIQQAVVIAKEDIPGNQSLVAYIVTPEESLSTNQLREFLSLKLPEYMVPNIFVPLETFPLTPNGKVDRQALPVPSSRPQLEEAYVMPKTEAERIIASVWQDLLQLEKVGINDNFFTLGGNSLLSISVHTKLNKIFGQELSIIELFKYPTIKELAKYLTHKTDVKKAEKNSSIGIYDRANKQKKFIKRREQILRQQGRKING